MRKTLLASAVLLGVGFAVPGFAQNMTPEQYLKQAQAAVHDHHRSTALMALNSAENGLLSDSAAREGSDTRGSSAGDPPVLRETARAREAVQQRHWKQAETYISAAMSHPTASQ